MRTLLLLALVSAACGAERWKYAGTATGAFWRYFDFDAWAVKSPGNGSWRTHRFHTDQETGAINALISGGRGTYYIKFWVDDVQQGGTIATGGPSLRGLALTSEAKAAGWTQNGSWLYPPSSLLEPCFDELGSEQCIQLVGSKIQETKVCNGKMFREKCRATCGHCKTDASFEEMRLKAIVNLGRPQDAPAVTPWMVENCVDQIGNAKCFRKIVKKGKSWCTAKSSNSKRCAASCGSKQGCDVCFDGPTKGNKVINTARCQEKLQSWRGMCSGRSAWAAACKFSCDRCIVGQGIGEFASSCEDQSGTEKCEQKLASWAGMCNNPSGAWRLNCKKTCGVCQDPTPVPATPVPATPVPATPVPETPVPEPSVPSVKVGAGECANERGVLHRNYTPFGEGNAISVDEALQQCWDHRSCSGISYAPWGFDLIIFQGAYDHAGPGGYGPITTTSPHAGVDCYKLKVPAVKVGDGECAGASGFLRRNYIPFGEGNALSVDDCLEQCAMHDGCSGISYAPWGFDLIIYRGAYDHDGPGGYGPPTTTSPRNGVECYKLDEAMLEHEAEEAADVNAGPEHRWDRAMCGYNINGQQQRCEEQGCLWGPLEHGSQDPWCYHKFSHKCAVNGHDRQDCGAHLTWWQTDDHKRGECESAGCCWQPTSHGENRPWCFRSN